MLLNYFNKPYFQKELKNMVRKGIPDCYRPKLWNLFINHHVSEIRKAKGKDYFAFLCNQISESQVIEQFCIALRFNVRNFNLRTPSSSKSKLP